MEDTAIVVCLHGDELYGLEVADKISKKIPLFIGNPLAIEKRKRYVDKDLNRVFPGDLNGTTYEEKRAAHLLKELKDYKYIIDIHSSSCDLELFGIITKPAPCKLELAKKLKLKKIVLMSEEFGKNSSLIDHVGCGISLEIGPHEKKENIEKIIEVINNTCNGEECSEPKMFKVFDSIKGDAVNYFIKNFKPVKKGDLIAKGEKDYYAEFDFIPLFVGEKAYKGILCLATKEVNSLY